MQNLLLIIANVILVVIGQTFIKMGMNKVGGFEWHNLGSFLVKAFTNPLAITGIILYIISSAIWLMVLSKVDLSFAYPMLSLGYVLILIISAIFLHETVGPMRIVGVLLIVIGIIVVFRTH